MTLVLSDAARNAAVDAVTALINTGGTPGWLKLYTSVDVLLASLRFQADAFMDAGSAPLSIPGSAKANNVDPDTNTPAPGGTATKFKIYQANGSNVAIEPPVITGSVALTSGGDINFNNNVFVPGGICSISSLILTCP